MAKDYARHIQYNPDGGQRRINPKLLIIAALVSIGCISVALYLYKTVDFQQIEERAATQLSLTLPKKKPAKPTFEFYTMLPKGQSSAAKKTAQKSATTAKATPSSLPVAAKYTKKADQNARVSAKQKPSLEKKLTESINHALASKAIKHYQLQVGSFQRYKEADQLKATLLLEGFNVSIKSYQVESTTWYRVMVGPYQKLEQAKQNQLALEEANYDCLLRQVS